MIIWRRKNVENKENDKNFAFDRYLDFFCNVDSMLMLGPYHTHNKNIALYL